MNKSIVDPFLTVDTLVRSEQNETPAFRVALFRHTTFINGESVFDESDP